MLRSIEIPGGRRADVLLAEPGDGLPLVLHHGTPGGPVAWARTVAAAQARGLRVIIPARPGYAGSTPRPGRRVADVAGDVAAVLDALGCEEFLTVGWSGGGPHALACSALLPGRCLAAAAIASVAPYGAPDLDWLAGMGPENVEEFGAALAGEAALTAFLDHAGDGLRTVRGPQIAVALGGLVSAADAAVLAGEFARFLAASIRSGCAEGLAGWRDDDLAFTADWGFPLDAVGPVAIWQGSEDRMVPQEHGKWLASHIPHAQAWLRPGEGHLTFEASGLGEVLDNLIALAGLSR